MARRRAPEDTGALVGRRVLVTGAARGIGAALARRLDERGARVAVVGLEPERLAETASALTDPYVAECDVCDLARVETVVAGAAEAFGGLDVIVANAGVVAQFPLLTGDPSILERTLAVNTIGAYNTMRAGAPHVAHSDGYVLAVASLAAAVHFPLLGAYSASKAAVEALANTLRIEIALSGAKVGVAYFAELDTDMANHGLATEAVAKLTMRMGPDHVAPLEVGIDALERGIVHRSRRIGAPGWVRPVLPARMAVQRFLERVMPRQLEEALEIAARERVTLSTPQPGDGPAHPGSGASSK